MAHSRRKTPCSLALLLAVAVAASLAPPAACRTIKGVPFTSISSFVVASFGQNTLQMDQVGPKPGTTPGYVITTQVALRGTLYVPDPAGDGANLRRIDLMGIESVLGSQPPATASLSTPSYTSQLASTTFTAKMKAMPAEGCVQEFPADAPPACIPVLVDVDWAAKGVRVLSYDSETRWTIIAHDSKPPRRGGQTGKGVGTDYTASKALHVRVVKADTKEELFKGSFPCNTTDICTFAVSQQVGRVIAPV